MTGPGQRTPWRLPAETPILPLNRCWWQLAIRVGVSLMESWVIPHTIFYGLWLFFSSVSQQITHMLHFIISAATTTSAKERRRKSAYMRVCLRLLLLALWLESWRDFHTLGNFSATLNFSQIKVRAFYTYHELFGCVKQPKRQSSHDR